MVLSYSRLALFGICGGGCSDFSDTLLGLACPIRSIDRHLLCTLTWHLYSPRYLLNTPNLLRVSRIRSRTYDVRDSMSEFINSSLQIHNPFLSHSSQRN